MSMLQNVKKFFRLPYFRERVAEADLFRETATSVLSGLFIVLWGVLFLANSFFQLSAFMKIRNTLLSSSAVEKSLANIHTIGLDPAMYLYASDTERINKFADETGTRNNPSGWAWPAERDFFPKNKVQFISEAVRLVSVHAKSHTGRIVVGIDAALLSASGIEGEEQFRGLVEVLSALPENVYVVFGGVLTGRSFVRRVISSIRCIPEYYRIFRGQCRP